MNAVDIAVSRAAEVLAAAPAALVSDVDGTISRIVSRPEAAVVSAGVQASLRCLAHELALVAVITAREEAAARRMVGVEELTYVGNYALDGATAADIGEEPLAAAKAAVRPLLGSFPCVTLEDKGVAFSLHYRNCEDETVPGRLLAVVEPLAEATGARVLHGKQVIELVPRALPNKWGAVERLLQERGISGVVYLGDDLGDIAVFRGILRRRAETGLPGLAVAVVDEETDSTVREAADLTLDGVDEAEALLAQLAGLTREGGA